MGLIHRSLILVTHNTGSTLGRWRQLVVGHHRPSRDLILYVIGVIMLILQQLHTGCNLLKDGIYKHGPRSQYKSVILEPQHSGKGEGGRVKYAQIYDDINLEADTEISGL